MRILCYYVKKEGKYMTSFYRWNAKHPLLTMLIAYIISFLLILILRLTAPYSFFSSKGFQTSVVFCILFLTYIITQRSPDILTQKPLSILHNQCDSYPFLAEMTEQLTYPYNPILKQYIQINYSFALRFTGAYQHSLDVLSSIPIDDESRTPIALRFIYYNNLSDLYHLMNRFEEADFYFIKSEMVYQSITNHKLKQLYSNAYLSNKSEFLFRKGEYSEALSQLPGEPYRNMLSHVDNSLFSAQCCIALGDLEKAIEHLDFVIQNGNKLYQVHVARNLLSEIS